MTLAQQLYEARSVEASARPWDSLALSEQWAWTRAAEAEENRKAEAIRDNPSLGSARENPPQLDRAYRDIRDMKLRIEREGIDS